MTPIYRILFLIILLPIFYGCKPTKHLKEGELLLTKVKFNIDGKIDEEELKSIVKQFPNRKLFGLIRFHLGIYNLVNQEKLTKKVARKKEKLAIRNKKREEKNKKLKQYRRTRGEWLMQDVGEAPVIFNEVLVDKSINQLNLYVSNKGFYNGVATDSIVLTDKTAQVYYSVHLGIPYTIRQVKFSINDTALIDPIRNASKKTLLEPGTNYDVDVIEDERVRIEKSMRNQGYYKFSRKYVYFEIDSNLNSHKIDIKQIIKNPMISSRQHPDSLIETTHRKYFINNVYVNSNFNPRKDGAEYDTLLKDGVYFLISGKENFRPEVLMNSIFIKSGELYSLKQEEYTNSRLADLRTFRFINIIFEESTEKDGSKTLDCFINLVPIARYSFVTELESTTNRMAPVGISGGFSFRNKNTFKGAELFEFKLAGGVEAQKQLTDNNSQTISNRFFNTVEFGPEISLYIPGLVIPRFTKKEPTYTNPKTNFKIAYNHQTRLDYTRNIGAFNISYNWRSSPHISHIFAPIDINLVRIDKSEAFQQQLLATNNRFLINTYQNHLIAASSYTFIFNNQDVNKFKNFNYFMFNLEGSGNILRGIYDLSGGQENVKGGYEMFGIQFAQYVKPEVELRMYRVVNKHSNMVYRMFAGVGIPLKNLNVLPFEKSYFGGGANGIRAWTARTLGPGTLADTSSATVDKIGDIQLEGNIEYRFDIIKMLKGAAFVDYGNIWLRNNDPNRPGGKFEFNNFYKATAIGVGLGARFDFSFMIIRLDAAIPVKDPALKEGERWIYQSKTQTNAAREIYYGSNYSKYKPKVNFNFGIGYPF